MGASNSKKSGKVKNSSTMEQSAFFEDIHQSLLDQEPMLRTMRVKKKVSALFKIQDIKTQYLKTIFLKDVMGTLEALEVMKEDLSLKDQEHDLILAFWFAVHLENVEIARHILKSNIYIRQLVTLALFRKNEKQSDQRTEQIKRQIYLAKKNAEKLNQSSATHNYQLSDSRYSSPASEEEQQNVLGRVHPNNDDNTVQLNLKERNSDVAFEGGSSESESAVGELNNSRSDNNYDNRQQYQSNRRVNLDQSAEGSTIQNDNYSQNRSRQGNMTKKGESGPQTSDNNQSNNAMNDEQYLQMRDAEHLKFMKAQGISEYDIEMMDINSAESVLQLKNCLRVRFPLLMTNILKIALFKGEEKLACVLTAYYEIVLDEEIIYRALEHRHFQFLQYIWAFKKNFLGLRSQQESEYITFTQLFETVKTMYDSNASIKEGVQTICKWMLITDDNILLALLYHYQDQFALDFMGYYNKFIDKELFLYSLTHGNKMFLQYSLLIGAFDKNIFKEEDVIAQMLVIIKEGCRTNFLLNVLLLIDIALWKNKYLKELLNIFNDYVEQSYEKNVILLSYNPLLSISLSAEILLTIAKSRRRFENECVKIHKALMELGKMYVSKVTDEKFYEKLILDTDFKERTVLKIITDNSFEPLMSLNDSKAENLMVKIWYGKEATKCDGNIYGYSNISHIIWSKAKKMGGKRYTYFEMISNFFEPNFIVDYTFQYRYRTKSVAFHFNKEFFFAFCFLVLFQYVNYQYLNYFKGKQIFLQDNYDLNFNRNVTTLYQFNPDTSLYDFASVHFQIEPDNDQFRISKFTHNKVKYQIWNLPTFILSASLISRLILTAIFNIFSAKKVPYNKWLIIDSIYAVLNIASMALLQQMSPEQINNRDIKNYIDYFMVFVLVMTWIRFFTYFLVIKTIAKMLLTLYEMLYDTSSFLFICICYTILAGSIFTTFFQDVNPQVYTGLLMTMRTLFDATMAVYNYNGMGNQETFFSICLMIHSFFANILLVNFLIAILSATYENMKEIAIFKYKINLFQYCERYFVGFENEDLGEIIVHVPPLCMLSGVLILFAPNKATSRRLCKAYSYMNFWVENFFYLFAFLFYEILLMPIAYAKTFINIVTCASGLFSIIFYCMVWFISGLFFGFFLVIRDVYFLAKILAMHQGCRQKMGLPDELKEVIIDKDLRIRVYNEVRETIMQLYLEYRKQIGGMEDYDPDNTNLNDLNILDLLEEDDGKFGEEVFIVKESVIGDEWKKRKARLLVKKQEELQQETVNPKKVETKATGKSDPNKSVSGVSGIQTAKVDQQQQKGRKQQLISELIGRKKGGVSAAIIEAMFQKAKGAVVDSDDDENVDNALDFDNLEEILVKKFFAKFIIISESSTLDQVSMILILKAMPNPIVDFNLEQMELFNFKIYQDSLIAFQNVDIVNAFEYFDVKNRERVQHVKDMLIKQRKNLDQVHEIIGHVKNKVQTNEEIFAQFSFLDNEINNRQNANSDQETKSGITSDYEVKKRNQRKNKR